MRSFQKCLLGLPVAAFAVVSVTPASADTLAYWRFEGDGVTTPTAGDFLTDTDGRTTVTSDGILAIDSSGNGNHLYTWDNNGTGHQYQSNVSASTVTQTGAANNFSIQNNNNWPASFTWSAQSSPTSDIETVKPLAWTIEASINQTASGTNQTFVGRDGNGVAADGSRAPLYFKTLNGTLQILFTDEAGNSYDLSDSTGALSLNTWYNVAAVSDGSTLKLYKDSGAGYVEVGSMALIAGDTRLAYDDNGSSTAGDTQWGWTVGRGRYGNSDSQFDNHVDRWFGYIDEIRISDAALSPDQFLFSSAVPEPASLALLGLGGLCMVARRRH